MDRADARSPVRGLGGRHPRRDPVHDPRRGHGLGPGRRGQLGRHGPDGGRVPATGRGRARRSAPRAGSRGPAAGSSTRPPGSSTPRRAPSSRPRPASTSPRTTARKRDLQDRYAFRPAEPAADGTATPTVTHERPSIVMTAPTQSEVTARAVAFVAERRDPAEALGTSPGRADQRPRRVRRGPDGGACADWPIPTTSPGSSASRRASAPSTASAGRCWPRSQRGFRNATRGDRPTTAAVRRRPPVPRGRARGPLVRLRPARAHPRHRDRADLAAPAPRRARGGRLDHRRFARPPVRQGDRRRALPLGRARAARLLPVALGAPARRLDDRDDDPRRPATRPRPGRRRPRPAAPRPAHRRRRAGRPEGAVVGLPLADGRRCRGDRGRASGRDRASRPTDDGHRAWVIRDTLSKLDPATADELRDRLAGIRRHAGAPSTSAAADTIARFGRLPDPRQHPEPPL